MLLQKVCLMQPGSWTEPWSDLAPPLLSPLQPAPEALVNPPEQTCCLPLKPLKPVAPARGSDPAGWTLGYFWQLLVGCHSLANNAFRGLTLKSFHMHGAGSLHRHGKGCCKRHVTAWSDRTLHMRVYIAYNFMCDGRRGQQTPLL